MGRDAVHVGWSFKNRQFRLVDTAGLLKIRPKERMMDASMEKRRMRLLESVGRYDTSLPGVQVSADTLGP